MKRNMKRILAGICFLLAVCFCLTMKSDKVYAQGAWYEDYEYELASFYINDEFLDYLMLYDYEGNDTSLYVPAKTVVDGVTYTTKLPGSTFKDEKAITTIRFEKGVVLDTEPAFLFWGMDNLKSVNVEVFDMSQVTDVSDMFKGCKSLEYVNVSGWDMSNVTSTFGLFWECESLKNVDVSKWDVSNVTEMERMFAGCKSLSNLNVSRWNTGKVESMNLMFEGCEKLSKINLNNWNVSGVKQMNSMFWGCKKLTAMNLSKWDTANVMDMSFLFNGCHSLQSLNVKGWDTSEVRKMTQMFGDNYSLKKLDLSSFDMSMVKDTNGMFWNCVSLKTIKTPKNIKKKIEIDRGLTYKKKVGKRMTGKELKVIPKGKKSITLVAVEQEAKATAIKKLTTSKGKIKVKWNAVPGTYEDCAVQYEVQCSTNKKFTDAAGTMVKPLIRELTLNVEENVTDRTNATFKGLEKGKTYYVRIRVIMDGHMLSDWSKAKKIKVK